MTKISNISGFPEWLPEEKLAEDRIIAGVKQLYSSFGYVPIETPAAELLSTLSSKGVVDKELYALKRAQSGGDDDEAELGLHFDLTVPFARYVAQHFNELRFPFRRYQVQKVWRGDRPQKGRFREFYQFDIDVIARDELPLSLDAEVITLVDKAFCSIGLGEHVVKLNNRKLLLGFYGSLGIDEGKRKSVITVVDKIDKIGGAKVKDELVNTLAISIDVADKIVALTGVKVSGSEAVAKLKSLEIKDELFDIGQRDIEALLDLLPPETLAHIQLDLSLARGLDYYTGAIFEIIYKDFADFGSVGSGGRYDDLASEFINKKLPGVGASIGITRLMDFALRNKLLDISVKSLTPALVAVYSENQRKDCIGLAAQLRAQGVGTEVYFKSPKLGKQIEYAESKGIQYVFFLDEQTKEIQVKDLRLKEQKKVDDIQLWAAAIGKLS